MRVKRSYLILLLVVVFVTLVAAGCAEPEVREVVVTQEVEKIVTQEVEKIVTQEVEVVKEPDYVTIRMNWTYGGYHAWFFYGKDEGFWRDEDIIVEIREGNGSGNVARTVANKEDDFAYITPDPAFAQISQGAPIKFIYTVDGGNQTAYICRNDRGIETIDDLEGKVILTSPGSSMLTVHPAVLEAAGVDYGKVGDLTLVDPSAIVPTVLAGRADCMMGGASDQVALMRSEGHDPVVFLAQDYGVGGVGGALITHQDTIDNNPDLVERFVRAAQGAQKACMENPDDCVAALLRSHPQQDPEAMASQFELNGPWVLSPKNTKQCYGLFIEEDWNDLYTLLKNMEDSPIEGDHPVTYFYDDSFVPPCD